jgi:hypothetical protein
VIATAQAHLNAALDGQGSGTLAQRNFHVKSRWQHKASTSRFERDGQAVTPDPDAVESLP